MRTQPRTTRLAVIAVVGALCAIGGMQVVGELRSAPSAQAFLGLETAADLFYAALIFGLGFGCLVVLLKMFFEGRASPGRRDGRNPPNDPPGPPPPEDGPWVPKYPRPKPPALAAHARV